MQKRDARRTGRCLRGGPHERLSHSAGPCGRCPGPTRRSKTEHLGTVANPAPAPAPSFSRGKDLITNERRQVSTAIPGVRFPAPDRANRPQYRDRRALTHAHERVFSRYLIIRLSPCGALGAAAEARRCVAGRFGQGARVLPPWACWLHARKWCAFLEGRELPWYHPHGQLMLILCTRRSHC